MTDESDELDYATSAEANMTIIREIARVRAKERMKDLLPPLMAAVAKALVKAGVDFSKAKGLRPNDLTEEEWDKITEEMTR